jgi:hypothetical protein
MWFRKSVASNRVAHDENTRIDRPAHVGDRIEVFADDKGRAVLIRNIDQDGRSQKTKIALDLG